MNVIRFLSATLLLIMIIPAVAANETIAIWLKAIDKDGKAVSGLVAEDFSIYEDNQQMAVTCLEAPDEETPAKKRKLILAVDLYNTSNTELYAIREEAQNFVDGLDPGLWDVMLATIMAGPPAEVESYTDQFDEIYNDIESMKGNTFRDQQIIQRKREIQDLLSAGRKGKSRAYQLVQFYAQDEHQTSQQSFRGIAGLAKYIPDAQEHVVIVFISGGINTHPGLQYVQLLEKAEAGGNFDSDTTAFRNFSLADKIPKQISSLLEKNVTIYSLNTRGNFNPLLDHSREQSLSDSILDRSTLTNYQEGMDGIAALTGGLSFKNSNDYAKPFATILDDMTGDYTICYKPPEHEKDGYRKVEVRTNKSGIKLRHRKGYWISEK